MCYYFGHGTEQDYDRAVSYFRRAAERGHVRAMTRLGVCYETGHGAQQDPQQAETLYRRSADLGDPEGQYCLAALLRRRKDPHAHQEAALLLKRPAAVGMPRPSICWAPATKPATVWRKSPNTPCTCTSRPPSRDTQRPWCGWASAMRPAAAWRRTPPWPPTCTVRRQSGETVWLCAAWGGCMSGAQASVGTCVRRRTCMKKGKQANVPGAGAALARVRSALASPPAAAAEGKKSLRRLLDRLKGKS